MRSGLIKLTDWVGRRPVASDLLSHLRFHLSCLSPEHLEDRTGFIRQSTRPKIVLLNGRMHRDKAAALAGAGAIQCDGGDDGDGFRVIQFQTVGLALTRDLAIR